MSVPENQADSSQDSPTIETTGPIGVITIQAAKGLNPGLKNDVVDLTTTSHAIDAQEEVSSSLIIFI